MKLEIISYCFEQSNRLLIYSKTQLFGAYYGGNCSGSGSFDGGFGSGSSGGGGAGGDF